MNTQFSTKPDFKNLGKSGHYLLTTITKKDGLAVLRAIQKGEIEEPIKQKFQSIQGFPVFLFEFKYSDVQDCANLILFHNRLTKAR